MADVLPNAPLVEVVFELRWELPDTGQPAPLRNDPGYPVLLEEFSRAVRKDGFRHIRDMQGAAEGLIMAHRIGRRFYKSEASAYPLVQIGPGIFAANEGPGYEWKKYKALCLKNLRHVLNSYPNVGSIKLSPSYIELRYIDSFPRESEVGKKLNMYAFLEQRTNLGVSMPTLFDKFQPVGSIATRRLISEFPVKRMRATKFKFDIGTGQTGKGDSIFRMETNVTSIEKDVPAYKTKPGFVSGVDKWLEKAHSMTSLFFQEFVKPDLLEEFK